MTHGVRHVRNCLTHYNGQSRTLPGGRRVRHTGHKCIIHFIYWACGFLTDKTLMTIV